MGYQIGHQCFSNLEEAKNYYFSLVSPTIDSDGHLWQPEYNGKDWVLNGQLLNLSLPECDPLHNFAKGAELGWLILGVMASLYVFDVLKKLLK